MTENKSNLQKAVRQYASDLGKKIEHLIADVSTLEVRTYAVPPEQVPQLVDELPDLAQIATQGALQLRAYTQVSFDGDTTMCIPTDEDGQVDHTLWGLHQQTVAQATANRNAMLKAVGEAAAAALKALGLVGE